MKLTLYESDTLEIIQSLETGVDPWKMLWHSTASLPVSLTTGKPYRGVNLLLLGLAPYIDHRWITFRQVQERGCSIKSGEKATMVVFWKFLEPPSDSDEPEKRIPVPRYFHVLNVKQCEGLNVPALCKVDPPPEQQRIERADLLIHFTPNPSTIS